MRFGSHPPSFPSQRMAAVASSCMAAKSFGSRFTTRGARSTLPCLALLPCPRRSRASTCTPRSRSASTTGSQEARSCCHMGRRTTPAPPFVGEGQKVADIWSLSAVASATSRDAGSAPGASGPDQTGPAQAHARMGSTACRQPRRKPRPTLMSNRPPLDVCIPASLGVHARRGPTPTAREAVVRTAGVASVPEPGSGRCGWSARCSGPADPVRRAGPRRPPLPGAVGPYPASPAIRASTYGPYSSPNGSSRSATSRRRVVWVGAPVRGSTPALLTSAQWTPVPRFCQAGRSL